MAPGGCHDPAMEHPHADPDATTQPHNGAARHWPGAASTPASPTGPIHYAALVGVFALGLGGVIALSRRRERTGAAPVALGELPVLALATFALADVVAKEKISTWLREPFAQESAEHKAVHPEGQGMRRAVGELLTCTRCMGTWSALGLLGLRAASPASARVVTPMLALTGANDVLQGGFRLLAERTNREVLANERARRDNGGGQG